MKLKAVMAKALAPMVQKAAKESACLSGLLIINQPKFPKKLMHTVK